MSLFALLWVKILRSSLWIKESKETRLVWVTMLALKDEDGRVQSSVVGLADAAKVSLEECREALRILLAPDEDDTSKVDEGRRIREIPGGWQIVNNDLYRYSSEERREFWRKQKALQRAIKAGDDLDPATLTDAQLNVWAAARRAKKALGSNKQKLKKGTPLPGENGYVEACERGDMEAADRIVGRDLPKTPPRQDG